MKTRSALRNRSEYLLVLGVFKSLQWTPLPLARRLARVYLRLFARAVPRLRRVALRNLALAMPEKPEAERRLIADGVFDSLARVLLAVARFPKICANLPAWIEYEGFEHFERALACGRGVLFATAHLGNWELSAFAHGLSTAPMHVVVRPLDNPLIDDLIASRRALTGNQVIGKQDFARGILKALHANQAVGILIDQNTSLDQGSFVDFFGIPACSGTSFARLAARTGAVVVPGYALWSEERKKHVLRFYPPVPMSGDAVEDTQRLQSHLEKVIREYPDQWLWIHRRWKTRPPGEPGIY